MSTALGIVLAVAAMPAAADWRNFFVQTNPPAVDSLPLVLSDPLTELNDLPPPDLGGELPPSDFPVVLTDSTPQTSSVPEPGTISLFALALLSMGLSMAHRRQRKERADRQGL